MKKITFVLALSAVVLASCQKNEAAHAVSENEVFTASVESFDVQTRTSMTPEKYVVWSQGDRLAIFQGSTVADEYQVNDASAGKANGAFSIVDDDSGLNGDFSAGTELPCNVSFYPYADGLTLTGAVLEDVGSTYEIAGFVLPSTQKYAAGSFGNGSFPMVAVTMSISDHTLKFKNVLGAMKLQLKGTQKVVSVKVEGNNDEKLSGAAIITAYATNLTPAITMAATDDASKSVTLDCGDGVQLNESTANDFIIALPPVLFSEGFKITVTDSDEATYIIAADVANTVLRSSILSMPAVTLETLSGTPDVPGSQLGDYVDEYGINHGPGVKIGETVWAPVNCGYKAAVTDADGNVMDKGFPYGKLYQWGRKYGQGYDGELYDINGDELCDISDSCVPTLEDGPVSIEYGQSESKSNYFFTQKSYPHDWVSTQDDSMWNSGTEDAPVKTTNDPCPIGWRVPTKTELNDLRQNHSSWTINEDGQNGYWFSGPNSFTMDVPHVFFPAAGLRRYDVGYGDFSSRGLCGNYWSSRPGGTVVSPYKLYFSSSNMYMDFNYRAFGFSVRCVQE